MVYIFPVRCLQNVLAYFAKGVSCERKMFMETTPVDNVIKLFTSVIYGFLQKATVFLLVPGKLFKPKA
jgi:hypothetical protein